MKTQIPIYIISLNRTPERRLSMQRQLDSLGLDYQWIEAVDAQDFKPAELEGLDLEDEYQPGAMACLLSHVKCYERAIQNKHRVVCVLEDDAELLPTLPDILNSGELHKEGWELLLLAHHSVMTKHLVKQYFKRAKGVNRPYYQFFLGAMVKNPSKIDIKNHYIADPQGNSLSTMPLTTTGYLIRLSAAKKLREVAITYQKSLYIDDITGCADMFEVSLRLITPPCVRINPIYLGYSTVDSKARKRTTNISTLPHQEQMQLYIRDRWAALTTYPLKAKLRICFLITLMKLGLSKITEYIVPWKRYNRRIYRVKNEISSS